MGAGAARQPSGGHQRDDPPRRPVGASVGSLELAQAAVEDLRRMMLAHSLPPDTPSRVRASLEPLRTFPLLGPALHGRWGGYLFAVGPWRWMILVYRHLAEEDRVVVVTIQDARTSSAVTNQ